MSAKSPIHPTVGRTVMFVMPGNAIRPDSEGQIRPAVIVRVFERPDGETPCVNLQVFVDGTNDGYLHDRATQWVTSCSFDADKLPGSWHWPEIKPSVPAPVAAVPAPVAAVTASEPTPVAPSTEPSADPTPVT